MNFFTRAFDTERVISGTFFVKPVLSPAILLSHVTHAAASLLIHPSKNPSVRLFTSSRPSKPGARPTEIRFVRTIYSDEREKAPSVKALRPAI